MLLATGCGKKTYERADLEKKVKGLSDDQLRQALGDPDGYSRGHYTYKNIVRKASSSDLEGAIIVVENGRVAAVMYPSDPPVMNQLPPVKWDFK